MAIGYARPAALEVAQVLRVDHEARRWRVYHETYAVCTVLEAEGEAELTYRGKLHHAGAGHVLLMEPGEVHANTKITPPASFRVLFLPPALVARAAAELGLRAGAPHWRAFNVRHPLTFRTLARLHASLESSDMPLERESRFAECLRLLLHGYSERRARPRAHASHAPGLARCREFIRAHYAEPLTLDALAAVASMSRYHLVRAFAQAFGLAPHRYQIHVRIEKARALLACGMRAAQVAHETGFADQSHFCRHFSEVCGVTPRQYFASLHGDERRVFATLESAPLSLTMRAVDETTTSGRVNDTTRTSDEARAD